MDPDEAQAFGDLLRRFRSAAGLTQQELADRSGVSARAIGDLERDQARVPHQDTLDLLASALELSSEQRTALRATRRRKREFRSQDADQSTLPRTTNCLVGRETEIARASIQIRRPDVRLLTLTGAGGVGKTRLALELARLISGEFADGVYILTLAALADPHLVPATVARALGVSLTGKTPAVERLSRFLRDKQTLILLDNCEHLSEACGRLLAVLFSAAPGLKVLATSRAPLGISTEHEHLVPPLELPDVGENVEPADLRASPAVALFLVRAAAVVPNFHPSDHDLATIAEVCRRLDGIPLAIELAAARVRLLTPAALLARLDKPLSLLTGGPLDLPQRQQTLRQTINWSYALLTPAEQVLLARFSVFVGGATINAIEAVNATLGVDPEETLLALDGLVRDSLIRRDEDAAGEPRFSMLEMVREYARELLDGSRELGKVCRAHATCYLNLAEQVDDRLSTTWRSDPTLNVMSLMEPERSNHRAALSWAAIHDRMLQLRLAVALGSFWLLSGTFTEGRHWLEEALNSAPDGPIEQRALAYTYIGRMASHQSDYRTAEHGLTESLALFREAGDARQTAWALHGLGRVLLVQGDRQRGITLLEESLELSDGQDLSWGGTRGLVLEVLGAELVNRGEPELVKSGARILQDGIAVSRAARSANAEGLSLAALAWAAYYSGDIQRARALLDEALAIWQVAHQHILGVHVRLTVGWFSLLDGQLDTAAMNFVEGLRESAEVENWARVVDALRGLAGVASRQGRHERAARLFGAAARLRETSGWQGYPSDPAYHQVLTAARECCESATWEAAWKDGGQLTVEIAISEALSAAA